VTVPGHTALPTTKNTQLDTPLLRNTLFYMIKTVTKIGNSKGIILDTALLEMAHLKEGDQLSVSIHEGGTISFTPLRDTISPAEATETAKSIIGANSELFDRLSK